MPVHVQEGTGRRLGKERESHGGERTWRGRSRLQRRHARGRSGNGVGARVMRPAVGVKKIRSRLLEKRRWAKAPSAREASMNIFHGMESEL